MFIFNLMLPVAALTIGIGAFNDVVKPVAKASWDTGVVVYEKSVEIIKDVTTEDAE